ncbi:GM24911 [Drosophila sechellia]|uniref:GM24911 n=1 Tax=Drosophila sechellia TaxID=7238 RepID=B4HK39_DROSE|nr:GM24911 [Drosophila sechellia]
MMMMMMVMGWRNGNKKQKRAGKAARLPLFWYFASGFFCFEFGPTPSGKSRKQV